MQIDLESVELSPPVVVSVYTRLAHFKRCIKFLQACTGSEQTELYIASDAAKNKEDWVLVDQVREYCMSITGFKKITLLQREKNLGASLNVKMAVEEVFLYHDRLIFMEDDVEVGKGFLGYMTNSLSKLKNSNKVYAVSGYLHPRLENHREGPFFLNKWAPYGIGIWKEKYYELEALRSIDNYKKVVLKKTFFLSYEKISPHSVRALPLILNGYRFGDFEYGIILLRKNKLVLYPHVSLTKSTGFDGTGLHSGKIDTLQLQECSDIELNEFKIGKILLDNEMSLKLAHVNRKKLDLFFNSIIFYLINSDLKWFKSFLIFRNLFKSVKRVLKNY